MKPILLFAALLLPLRHEGEAQSLTSETNLTVRATGTNSSPACIKVNMFFGGGSRDPLGRKAILEKTGVVPYDQDQVLSLEDLRDRAMKAIQREGRPIDAEYVCGANIAMTPGRCTLLFHKNWSPGYQVSFDSNGLITMVSGSTGSHGEGFWKREYRNGQPVGSADRSQPSGSVTTRESGAAGSVR